MEDALCLFSCKMERFLACEPQVTTGVGFPVARQLIVNGSPMDLYMILYREEERIFGAPMKRNLKISLSAVAASIMRTLKNEQTTILCEN